MKIGDLIKVNLRSEAWGYDPSEDNVALLPIDDIVELKLSDYSDYYGFPFNDYNTLDLLHDRLHEQVVINIRRALLNGLTQ